MKGRGKADNNNKKNQSIIEEKPIEEDKEDEDEDDDDQINEQLFSMYDEMFKHFNNFGSMFQNSAHLIGMLIRKNMLLNQQNEQLENVLPQKDQEIKQMENSYVELLKQLQIKDKQIEDLLGENTGLKLQLDQFLRIPKPNQPPQRDILKEREQAALLQRTSKSSKPQRTPLLSTESKSAQQSNDNQKPELKPATSNKPPKQDYLAGTYESFFDLDKVLGQQAENESCSLKDLFSHKNSKKRGVEEIKEHGEQEKWIDGKGIKKRKRKSYFEDSQMAEKFDQLSQAFFQASKSSGTGEQMSLKYGRNSIGSEIGVLNNNEDSVSSASVINACIKFDSNQNKNQVVQGKLNFQKQQNELKAQDKKFELKMVDQVSESQVNDFFEIKKEKKNERGNSNAQSTTTRSNSGAYNNKRPQKKLL